MHWNGRSGVFLQQTYRIRSAVRSESPCHLYWIFWSFDEPELSLSSYPHPYQNCPQCQIRFLCLLIKGIQFLHNLRNRPVFFSFTHMDVTAGGDVVVVPDGFGCCDTP